MPIYYVAFERIPNDDLPPGHRFEKEFEIRCYSTDGEEKMVTQYQYSYAHGMVLSTGERNGYHDSDFYAIYMTEDCEFKEVEYATTRFPCQGCGATVDAKPDVKAAYQDYLDELKENRIATRRRLLIEDGMPEKFVDEFMSLEYGWGEAGKRVRKLLSQNPDNMRSKFRISCRNQIIEWFETPVSERRYSFPLSPRQMEYV